MKADGSWDEFEYGRDIWSKDNTHLDRLYKMAQYATNPTHPLYGDSAYLGLAEKPNIHINYLILK